MRSLLTILCGELMFIVIIFVVRLFSPHSSERLSRPYPPIRKKWEGGVSRIPPHPGRHNAIRFRARQIPECTRVTTAERAVPGSRDPAGRTTGRDQRGGLIDLKIKREGGMLDTPLHAGSRQRPFPYCSPDPHMLCMNVRVPQIGTPRRC